jgi:hypothetical protein
MLVILSRFRNHWPFRRPSLPWNDEVIKWTSSIWR